MMWLKGNIMYMITCFWLGTDFKNNNKDFDHFFDHSGSLECDYRLVSKNSWLMTVMAGFNLLLLLTSKGPHAYLESKKPSSHLRMRTIKIHQDVIPQSYGALSWIASDPRGFNMSGNSSWVHDSRTNMQRLQNVATLKDHSDIFFYQERLPLVQNLTHLL